MLPTISTGNVASALAGEYEVANSCRFNDGSSDSLHKTFSGNGNRKTFTFSAWVKRGIVSSGDHCLIATSVSASDDNTMEFFFQGGDKLAVGRYYNYNLITNALFRDPSAWYHIVLACDTTQSTASNRMRLYVNGSEITSFATASYPNQNDDLPLLAGSQRINIAAQYYTHLSQNTRFLDGYMTEVVMIDGQQLTPTSFGEFDSNSPNIWKPIDVSGLTFGTNGFYLDFENASSLGADVSGNSNNFTVNNLTSIDQSTDTCTNNFCTWNSIADNLDVTLSEGNLKVVHGTALERRPVISTFGVSKGKWFWEWKNTTSSTPANIEVGIVNYASPFTQGRYLGQSLQGDADFTTYIGDGIINMSGSTTDTGTTYTTETISVAVDMDNTLIYFYKNGSLVNSGGTNFSGMEDGSGFIFMANADRSGGSSYTASVNFGNPPYSESGGNSDANGYGNFSMSVPNGYYSLCSKNLAEFG